MLYLLPLKFVVTLLIYPSHRQVEEFNGRFQLRRERCRHPSKVETGGLLKACKLQSISSMIDLSLNVHEMLHILIITSRVNESSDD